MIQLQEGERIIHTCRRHWLIFVVAILQIAIAIVALTVLFFLTDTLLAGLTHEIRVYLPLAVILLLQVLWLVLFMIITDYYLDVWMVTDRHLIFIELHGLFNRTVSIINLDKIQDISVQVFGIFATILKFGKVRVQSAGTVSEFIFKDVPRPYEVKDLILRTRDELIARNHAGV